VEEERLEPVAEQEVIRRIKLRDLVWAGMTSNHLAAVLAVLAVGLGFMRDLIPQGAQQKYVTEFTEKAGQWLEQGGTMAVVLLAGGLSGMLLVGMIISVASSLVLFYNFTLSRSGEDLHRAYGLFTRRSSSLPRRRIQVLKIEERMVRRWFHLATLRADTAGGGQAQSGESKSGRDVLVPIMKREEVESLLPAFFPDMTPDPPDWKQVSRAAISRGTFKGSVLCLLWALVLVVVRRDWMALWPVGLIPVVYWTSLMSYRHLGYWLGEGHFRSRRGWLSRAGHVVPIRNAQSVVIRQTPWDRRHGVSALVVDTAGQAYTGGGPRISNVPEARAMELGWALARRAARTRYRW
jgi:putative membrane protein